MTLLKRALTGLIVAALANVFLPVNVNGQKKNYKRPPVKTPDTFRDANTPPDPASIGDLKWFEVFKDPELQKLIETAFVQNYDLKQAVARIDIERANLGITRSQQFPRITGTLEGTKARSSNTSELFPATVTAPKRTFVDLLLNLLTFEIDVWGRLRQQTKAARAELRASEEDRRAAMTTVVSDVATAYFNLLELDRELDIDRQTLAIRENSLQLIKAREQGGVASLLDVRQGEELVNQAEQAIPDTERLQTITENQLSQLVGDSPHSITRGQGLLDQQELPAVPPGLPSSLLERRPDIRAAEANLEAQHALIYVARAAFFPTISLTGFLGIESSALSTLIGAKSATWNFVPQVSVPIFAVGIKSGVKLAEAQQELALSQYQQVIQTSFREVADALIQYRKVRELRAKQEELVVTLRDRSVLAHARYEGGVDSLLEALDADRELFSAQLSVTQSRRNELLSLVQLYKALGGGWQQ